MDWKRNGLNFSTARASSPYGAGPLGGLIAVCYFSRKLLGRYETNSTLTVCVCVCVFVYVPPVQYPVAADTLVFNLSTVHVQPNLLSADVSLVPYRESSTCCYERQDLYSRQKWFVGPSVGFLRAEAASSRLWNRATIGKKLSIPHVGLFLVLDCILFESGHLEVTTTVLRLKHRGSVFESNSRHWDFSTLLSWLCRSLQLGYIVSSVV
jgi:hypothetical protein